jgi:hypothetical protein
MAKMTDDEMINVMVHECLAVMNVYTIRAYDKMTCCYNLTERVARLFCVRSEKADVLALIELLHQSVKDSIEEMYNDR